MQEHHPHETGQHRSSNRPRTSSIPLPNLQTNTNNYHSNAQISPVASPETPNATPLQYQKTRRLDFHGNGTYPGPCAGASRSFDTPGSRAASGPPLTLKSATSSPIVARPKGPEKASFRDLVARFNQSQSSSVPLASQRTERRTQSNQAESTGDRMARRREPQSVVDRPSPLLSSLQSTVDRINGTSIDALPPKSSSEPRHSHQQGHRTRAAEGSQHNPLAQHSNPPLFGEIVPGNTHWPSGYGIPPQSHRRNGSDGGSRYSERRISHSRSISDMSSPRTPSLDASFTRSNGHTLHPSNAHIRSRSDHAQFARNVEHGSTISPIFENYDDGRPHTPSKRFSQSRIPIPSPPRQAHSREHSLTTGGKSTRSLRAIINVPTPQTSPPLRSSRPRRDVLQARSVSPAVDRQKWSTQGSNASFGETTYREPHEAGEDQRCLAPDRTDSHTSQTQLPATTYQRPNRGLKVDVEDTSHDSHEGPPSTTTTHFEDDECPDLDVPGSFPNTDDTQSHEASGASGYEEEQDCHLGGQENGDWMQHENRSRNVLSQIMEMRRNRETGHFPPVTLPDLRSSLGTDADAGTIQIMLGETPMAEPAGSGWFGRDDKDRQSARDTSVKDTPVSRSSTSNLSPSSWDPTRSEDDASSQLTPEGDYSAINRILDQYHQSGVISPAMVHEFQQYILDVEPELLGDDEAEKGNVAKVALEDIIRDHALSNELSSTAGADEPDSQPNHKDPATSERSSLEAVANQVRPGIFKPGLQAPLVPATTASNDLFHHTADVAPPMPPPKDQSSSPAAFTPHPYEYDTSHEMKRSNSARLSVETPLLPPTPSTGGSIGFFPVTGLPNEVLHQRQDPELGTSLSAPVPAMERTRSAPPPHTGPNDDQEATPTADFRPSAEVQDATVSTPATSMQGARSFSETDHTPSSKTSLTDSTLVAAEQPSGNFPYANDAEQKRLNRRRQVLKELLDTEASYIQDMKVVEDIYKETSKSCEAVTSEDRRILFGNCATIIAFSESFLSALKKATVPVYVLPRQTKWRNDQNRRGSFSTSNSAGATDEVSTMGSEATDNERDRKTFVGEVFNQNMTRIEAVYTEYLKNHDSANQRLKKMQDVPRIKLWLQECHNYAEDITSAWDLDSLLVKPVQRVLKYPLLLKALIETTPESHPDSAAIRKAEKNMAEAAVRINDSKKRAEVLEQIMSNTKRKDFDISKLLGRRTDKLRQQVGLSDAVDDAEYRMLAQRFETRYVHLQIVLRDFELYKQQTGKFMDNLLRLMSIVEEMVSVGHTNSPELESKWRKVVMTFRDMHSIAFTDHESAVVKRCIDPIFEVIKLYEGPQRIMMKRKKRVVEYAKYTTSKNKGEKLDKRTVEQGEQFLALNETLKFELPKLFDLSNKLIWACMRNFVDLQVKWNSIWQRKARTVLEEQSDETPTVQDIVDAFNSDFNYVEAHVLSLGICNGSLLNDVSNYLASSSASFSTNETTMRPSLTRSSATSTGNQSPRIPAPDFDRRSGSFNMPSFSGRTSSDSQHRPQQQHGQSYYQERFRANSNVSNSSKNAGRSDTPKANTPYIPHQESRQQRAWDARPSQPQQTQSLQQLLPDARVAATPAYAQAPNNNRPISSSTFHSASGGLADTSPDLSQQRQTSGAFSSAMPMSDSPTSTRPASPVARPDKRERKTQYQTLYTAASLYDFNLKQGRTEAGYPYLFYAPGEIFDIIGTKGELWLAKNQDDPTELIGWVWEKHFAKLMPTET